MGSALPLDNTVHFLIVGTIFPLPLDQGDPLRVLALAEAAKDLYGDRLTFAVVRRPSTKDSDVQALRLRMAPASVMVFEPNVGVRSKSWRSRLLRSLSAVTHLRPPAIETQLSNEMRGWLAANHQLFQVALLIGEPAGAYAQSLQHPVLIWDKANVITSSTRARAETARGFVHRALTLVNALLARHFESRTLTRVNHVWVTSSDEAARLQNELGVVPEAVIPSALADTLPAHVPGNTSSSNIAWMSSFTYDANWAGLLRFLKEAGSVFLQSEVRVFVMGSGATSAQISALRNFSFVDYLGFVEDLAPVLSDVRLAIVPLWQGAGLKLKTITFMSYGLPVAGTTVAFEGIPSIGALTISDDPVELATSALAATPASLKCAGLVARRAVVDHFTSDAFRLAVQQHLRTLHLSLQT